MPFELRQKTYDYVDTSNARLNDRIEIFLEDGLVLVLMLPPDSRYKQTLYIDKQLTSTGVLHWLYEQAVKEAKRTEPRFKRSQYTFEKALVEVSPTVTLRDVGGPFDNQPVPGKQLTVFSLFEGLSGSASRLPWCIQEVRFITV